MGGVVVHGLPQRKNDVDTGSYWDFCPAHMYILIYSFDNLTCVSVKLSVFFTYIWVKLSVFFTFELFGGYNMKRKLFAYLQRHLEKKEITILTGARQTGKSTLLKQLEAYCRESNIRTAFFNLENNTLRQDLDGHPFNLLKYLPDDQGYKVAFIDEVQYLKDPSNFLKLIYDEYQGQIKLVVTGSSAFYIDDKFRDSLAGRKRIFHLLTCSFDEYLSLSGKMELAEEFKRILREPSAKTISIDHLRNEWELYMLYGGYPAVITESDRGEKIARLREIRDSFVKRDIHESGVLNETMFYSLFKILASQTGSLVNVNELALTLKIKHQTASNYITVLRKCFHMALVTPFHKNIRKELTKMPKLYMLDLGLRNCLLNNFDPLNGRLDKGEIWENMVYRVLAERYGLEGLSFWRTTDGNEVDFVLSDIDAPKAIEAKYDKQLIKPSKYKLFNANYPDIPLAFSWLSPFDEDCFRRLYS